jgi:hypothetical protein
MRVYRFSFGGAKRDRTVDLLNAIQEPCPLNKGLIDCFVTCMLPAKETSFDLDHVSSSGVN